MTIEHDLKKEIQHIKDGQRTMIQQTDFDQNLKKKWSKTKE